MHLSFLVGHVGCHLETSQNTQWCKYGNNTKLNVEVLSNQNLLKYFVSTLSQCPVKFLPECKMPSYRIPPPWHLLLTVPLRYSKCFIYSCQLHVFKSPLCFIWIYIHVVSMFWFFAVPLLSVVYVVFPVYTLYFYSKTLKEQELVTYYNIHFVGSVESLRKVNQASTSLEICLFVLLYIYEGHIGRHLDFLKMLKDDRVSSIG